MRTDRITQNSGHSGAPQPMLGYRCADCGYGACCRTTPARCPMCSGQTWNLEGWQPFEAADIPALTMSLNDADASLTREGVVQASTRLGSVFPGVPLS